MSISIFYTVSKFFDAMNDFIFNYLGKGITNILYQCNVKLYQEPSVTTN